MSQRPRTAAAAAWLSMALWVPALHAAEGFQVRYNMAGSLGSQMTDPEPPGGWGGGVILTDARIRKVTGQDGAPLRLAVPAGSVPLPPPLPAATFAASEAVVDASGRLRQANLRLAWLSTAESPDRQAFSVNLPHVLRKTQHTRINGSAPALAFAPAVPQPLRQAVSTPWEAQYQQRLDALATAETGEIAGWGDLELQAAWLHSVPGARAVGSVTWVLPTGRYDRAPGLDLSLGDFHTLRPALEVSWEALPQWRLGGRLTLGLNTRNRDNDLRSGHWAGLEAAAARRTDVGVVGLQVLRLQQLTDDSRGDFGANRYRSTSTGAFVAAPVPAAGVTLTVQHTAMVSSRNARHGQFTQVRLSRAF